MTIFNSFIYKSNFFGWFNINSNHLILITYKIYCSIFFQVNSTHVYPGRLAEDNVRTVWLTGQLSFKTELEMNHLHADHIPERLHILGGDLLLEDESVVSPVVLPNRFERGIHVF